MNQRYDPDKATPEERLARSLASGMLPDDPGSPEDRDMAELVQGLHALRREYRRMSSLPDSEASARMRAALREAMARDRRRRTVFERLGDVLQGAWLRPVVATAAVIVVAVISVVVFRSPGQAPKVVAVSDAGTITYRAPDGTSVTLRPNSRLVRLEGPSRRAYRIEGEAFFDVARDEEKPFVVRAGNGVVTVLGTRFSVGSWGASPTVFVDEGRVRFEDRLSGRAVELDAGQASELTEAGPSLSDRIDRQVALDWMEGAVVLDSQPLSAVIAELEHHFAIAIAYPEEIGTERLTGRVLLRDRNQALLDLGIVIGGEFVPTGSSAYRLDPD